jgi:triosephosphate isomerase (TIM)
MRKKIVAGNWKMNLDYQEGLKLVSEIRGMVDDEINNQVTIIVAPPFILLNSVTKLLEGSRVAVAAQNCSAHHEGAYTGEVSAKMIISTGAQYVIVGHSERRKLFKESDETFCDKMTRALENNLKIIFCVGESLDERKENDQFNVISHQLAQVVLKLNDHEIANVIIAYEPVWAIGTGLSASPEQASEMHAFIRKIIKDKFGDQAGENMNILYGGSCNATNASSLFSSDDIDGGLVGGASLQSRDFVNIAKCAMV